MRIVCAPSGIVSYSRPNQGIMDIHQGGFSHLSLDMQHCCSGQELENFRAKEEELKGERRQEEQLEAWQREKRISVLEDSSEIGRRFQKLASVGKENGITFPIARAPYLLRDTKRVDLEEVLLELHKACIRYCASVGGESIVIRPLFSGVEYGKEWEANRKYYLQLAPVAAESQVTVLLENQCQNRNGHMIRGMCSDAGLAAQWIDYLNKEAREQLAAEGREIHGDCFGFCMDVGVCNLCGQDMHEFAVTLDSRLKAVVLRDSDGQQEGAMLPFTCVSQGQPKTDWLSLIRGLRQIHFDGDLILEIQDTVECFSPLLRPMLMSLAKQVGEYFRWQIEIERALKKYSSIVLFGAGNMCRNFLKCYGEQYPPLFTCDNNEERWGTIFCGLEVKPPKALLSLPPDCGIFICNIYYREIEKQLREMGIESVEFFNDEYMPSFHFDRVKGV